MTKALKLDDYIKLKPWKLLDPYNCNLYPSVIKDNYNLGNKARFYIIEDAVLGRLYPNTGDLLWTLSSKKPLTEKIINNAAEAAFIADKNFTIFNVVSKNKLPEDLPKNINIKSRERDEYEYIYKTKPTLLLKSRNYLTPRRYVNKFIKLYGDHITIDIYKDDSDGQLNGEIKDLYHSWLEHTSMPKEDLLHETKAFNNYLKKRDIESYKKAYKLVLRYKGKIVGISINDIVSKNTAINLYFFCNLNLTGVSHYLFYMTNKYLYNLGVVELNFQEDRGSLGLRRFKKLLRPFEIYKMVTLEVDRKNTLPRA